MTMKHLPEKVLGLVTLMLSAVIGTGATQLKGAEGYTGVGADFLPMIIAGLLCVCGVLLLRQAFGGGLTDLPEGHADLPRPDWRGMAWLSAGLLVSAAAITTVGFILSCTLLFVLAVRGFRHSMGQGPAKRGDWARDALVGMAISTPVYWLFTQLLGLTLPGLTSTGWF